MRCFSVTVLTWTTHFGVQFNEVIKENPYLKYHDHVYQHLGYFNQVIHKNDIQVLPCGLHRYQHQTYWGITYHNYLYIYFYLGTFTGYSYFMHALGTTSTTTTATLAQAVTPSDPLVLTVGLFAQRHLPLLTATYNYNNCTCRILLQCSLQHLQHYFIDFRYF